jgi:hypothetical protein
MGKKTIKVKYTEDATIAIFSQNNKDLLEIYPENAMNGIWGNVIVPLQGEGHFYYRKDLGNGEMLICGECYSCSTEARYYEELGEYENKHKYDNIIFIEEDSLIDDDEFDQEAFDEYQATQATQATQVSENEKVPVPELRAYVVYWDDLVGKKIPITDNEFITEAELQGTIYSLKGFQTAFNDDAINSSTCSVRFLTV